MNIGSLILKNDVLVAPIAGYSDYPFRKICKQFGAAFTYTEMVSAKALCYRDKKTVKLLTPEDNMCGVQLFGREPEVFALAAKMLEDMGVPLIDVNMGCPAPKIVNNGEGSALLKEPDVAVQIVESLKKAVKIPITVKMRKGWNGCPDAALQLSQKLVQAGVDGICIHGRTREQYYSGKADREIIRQVKQSVSCPVIGNGDVVDLESYRNMKQDTGCDGVMLARGAIASPWLIRECVTGVKQNPTWKEKRELILQHYEEAISFYGERMAVLQMRKQFHCYIKGMHHASAMKQKINEFETYAEIKQYLKGIEA